MYRRKRTTTLVLIFLMLLAALVFVLWTTGSSRADGPPSDDPIVTTPATPTDDPCFRQDIECYDDVPVQQQLPEEVIGRQIDCPDGSVGRIVDVEGHNTCSKEIPAEPLEANVASPGRHFSEPDVFAYGALSGAIVGLIISTLTYLAFKAPRNGD